MVTKHTGGRCEEGRDRASGGFLDYFLFVFALII